MVAESVAAGMADRLTVGSPGVETAVVNAGSASGSPVAGLGARRAPRPPAMTRYVPTAANSTSVPIVAAANRSARGSTSVDGSGSMRNVRIAARRSLNTLRRWFIGRRRGVGQQGRGSVDP